MNASIHAIIHLFINKTYFSRYFRYILLFEIEPFSQRYNVPMRGSRNFGQGVGGPGQSDKKVLTTLSFSPQLILQQSKGQFQRNLSFFKVPEGVQHFP